MINQRPRLISPIAENVLTGLSRSPKTLPPKLFYDQEGSDLFEQITALPEYYLTRTERQILTDRASEIIALAGTDLVLVELGAGTAAKTETVIRAACNVQSSLVFYPVDVSPTPLRLARERLCSQFPILSVRPIVADYTNGLPELANIHGRKLVLYIGSSIGNFEPMDAALMLGRIRRSLSPGDALLLGADLAKHARILVPAYNDRAGVTEAFNKNILARINRELGGEFDLDAFRHLALWNPRESRMEIYLESLREQTVAVRDLSMNVTFAKGERIHTENSYKFTRQMIMSILGNSGFHLERTWTDRRRWFALHMARVTD